MLADENIGVGNVGQKREKCLRAQSAHSVCSLIRGKAGRLTALFTALLFLALLRPEMAYAAGAADGYTVTDVCMAMAVVQPARVRSGPDFSSPVLGMLEAGHAVNVCGQTDTGWYQIVYGNEIAYMEGKLLMEVPIDANMRTALAQQAAFVKQLLAFPAQALAEQQAAAQAQALAEQQAAAQAQALAAQQAAAQAQALAAQQAAQAQALAAQQAAAQAQALAAQQAAQALAAQQAAQAQAMAEQQAAQTQLPAGSGNVIFVGDSRIGQMGNAVGGTAAWPGVAFVSCYGGGVEWLSTQKAKQDIDQFVTPGSVIVLNYGVNDLSRHNDYISVIDRYSRDWRAKGATVFFASVGPVAEDNLYNKRNWAVEYFNNQLNSRLESPIGRIDLYRYLTLTGYTTVSDGLHYSPDTYAVMFQFLMQSVGRG